MQVLDEIRHLGLRETLVPFVWLFHPFGVLHPFEYTFPPSAAELLLVFLFSGPDFHVLVFFWIVHPRGDKVPFTPSSTAFFLTDAARGPPVWASCLIHFHSKLLPLCSSLSFSMSLCLRRLSHE